MKRHSKLAKAILSYSWKDFIEYRWYLLFWIVLESSSFFIMYFLWMFIYKSHDMISGYTLSAIITYYLVAYFVRQNTTTYIHWNITGKVNDGYFSHFLFRPMTHRIYYFYHNMGEKIIRFIMLLPMMVLLVFLVKGYLVYPNIKNVGFFLVSFALSFLLNIFFAFLVGYTAFWTEKSESLIYFKDALVYYVSGAMIPITFFGSKIAGILNVLPFRYFVSFPIEIYLGKVSTAQIYSGLFLSVFWLLIFILLDRSVCHYGIKRFSSVGN